MVLIVWDGVSEVMSGPGWDKDGLDGVLVAWVVPVW